MDGKRLNEVHPRICTNQPDYRFEESVMNKLYAFYCRAYQAVFRAALPILPYREPIQLDGLSSIVPLLAEKRIASVLLVTDASVRSLGLTSGLEAALKAAGVACAVYDKTVPNPTIANIEEGLSLIHI